MSATLKNTRDTGKDENLDIAGEKIASTDNNNDVDEKKPEMNSNDLPATSSNQYNPSGEDHTDEELNALRGDAIGDTLFSERFVLSTILKLRVVGECQDYEQDLCSLWDMTTSADITKFLLEQNAIEIFCACIEDSKDVRIIEILLGIIGNMCNEEDTRSLICGSEELTQTIFRCLHMYDPPVLVQLMRVLYTLFNFSSPHTKTLYGHFCQIHDDFMDTYAGIMFNSMNVELLEKCFSVFNALVCAFRECREPVDAWDIFLQPSVINGFLECFNTLLEKGDYSEESAVRRDYQIFANINWLLADAGSDKVMPAYSSSIPLFMDCLNEVLQPLHLSKTVNPFSKTGYYILDGLDAILRAIKDPFDERCLEQLIRIWHTVTLYLESENIEDEFNDSTDDINVDKEIIHIILLGMINRMCTNATDIQLPLTISKLPRAMADKLSKVLISNLADSPGSAQRIRTILDKQ